MNDHSAGVHFEDLENKGFLTIPSFLSADEIEYLLATFKSQGTAENANYSLVEVPASVIEKLKDKLSAVIAKVGQNTQIKVDFSAIHIGLFFESEKINFGWHQDHESFYALQNHYDYLNFFVPIQKPSKEKGNLQVVPWNVLETRYPEAYKRLVRSGGNNTLVIDGKTIFTEDQGVTAELPVDISEICVTPELEAGDLLVIRGDMIHQTQDVETARIAFSVRFTNPETSISRRELVTGGPRKTYMMINNWHDFGPMIKAFQVAGKKTMSWRQLQEEAKKIQPIENGLRTRGKVIHLYLWLQRIVAGGVVESIKRWYGTKRAKEHISTLEMKN